MNVLEDKIITRFGAVTKITTDNAKGFISTKLSTLCFNYGIVICHSSNYYPQGSGLAETSSNNLMVVIKKVVGDNKKS
jgi:hypothetical protein